MLIDAAHLPVAMTGGFDQQRGDLARFQMLRRALADTRRIEPMRFRQGALHPVVFGQTATAGLQGQSGRLQPFKEVPAGRIDGGSIFEGRLRLGKDTRKHIRFLVQEVLDELRALRDVTRPAGQGEVAHAMRAASCAAEDVLNLQGNVLHPTVGTSPPPLFEQAFPHLVAHAFPLLVLNTRDLRVLHSLRTCASAWQGCLAYRCPDPGSLLALARLMSLGGAPDASAGFAALARRSRRRSADL